MTAGQYGVDCDVVVLGSVNVDLVLPVECLPGPGQTVLAGPRNYRGGGKGANQAVAAARTGAKVAFIGCVGDDHEGASSRAELADEGVSTTYLRTSSEYGTGFALVLVSAAGENQIVVSPGANDALSRDDVEDARAVIGAARVLVAQLEVPLEAVRSAVRIGFESGTTVMLNLSPAMPVDSETLHMVDVLIVNQAEATFLLGTAPSDGRSLGELANQIRTMGPRAAVITAGADGLACATEQGTVLIDALPVPVVDTTGAGDAFAGTLAAQLAGGATLEAAAAAANAAGAAAVQTHGARDHAATSRGGGPSCG